MLELPYMIAAVAVIVGLGLAVARSPRRRSSRRVVVAHVPRGALMFPAIELPAPHQRLAAGSVVGIPIESLASEAEGRPMLRPSHARRHP